MDLHWSDKAKVYEKDLTLSKPCLQENLFRMIEGTRVVTLIKALKGSKTLKTQAPTASTNLYLQKRRNVS